MHGTLPLAEDQALASLRDGTAERTSVAALAREWGWSRGKVRQRLDGWRRTGDLPPVSKPRKRTRHVADTDVADPVPAPPPATASFSPAHSRTVRFGLGLAIAGIASVGLALAGIGMIETSAYAARVGGPLFAALAICADALVLFMPAAVAALWRRRSGAMIVAAALWLAGGAVTLTNLAGYVGSSDDAFRAARQSQSIERALALETLARLRHERAAISEMRPVGALNVAIRNAHRSYKPVLREALAIAERRDSVDAELSMLGASLTALPSVAIIDPPANVLSEVSGANISEISMRRARLLFLLLLPMCGGFVLGIAFALARRPGAAVAAG